MAKLAKRTAAAREGIDRNKLYTVDEAGKLVKERATAKFDETIEIAPLAFMRGRTLTRAFVILDEAQNTTPQQMKMFLTRLGEDSRMAITGDPSQVDLPRGMLSGLKEATGILRGVKGVEIVAFTERDVVRHPLVARIVAAYDKHERKSKE